MLLAAALPLAACAKQNAREAASVAIDVVNDAFRPWVIESRLGDHPAAAQFGDLAVPLPPPPRGQDARRPLVRPAPARPGGTTLGPIETPDAD